MIAAIALLAFVALTLDFAVPHDGVPATIIAGLVLCVWLLWRLVKFLFAAPSGEAGSDGNDPLHTDSHDPASNRQAKPH